MLTVYDKTRRGARRITQCGESEARRMIKSAYRDRRECRVEAIDFQGTSYTFGEVTKIDGVWIWFHE